MDKQKQIEEMAKDLTEVFEETPMELSFNYENGEVDIIKEKQALKVLDDITRQALIPFFAGCLTDLGYRKIPDAVVLTREKEDEIFNQFVEHTKKVRKETAEKFAERAKEAIINMKWARDDTHIKLVEQGDCLKAIDEIAKELTGDKV